MAAITWDNVTDHAPELSTVDSDAQDDILAYVNTVLAVVKFGGEDSPRTKLARIYLAAHFASLASLGGSGSSGPVIEEEVGDIRRRYAEIGGSSETGADFNRTTYGQSFLAIVRASSARGPQVI